MQCVSLRTHFVPNHVQRTKGGGGEIDHVTLMGSVTSQIVGVHSLLVLALVTRLCSRSVALEYDADMKTC